MGAMTPGAVVALEGSCHLSVSWGVYNTGRTLILGPEQAEGLTARSLQSERSGLKPRSPHL